MSRHTVDTLFRDDQISITKDTVTTGKKKFFTKDIQGVEVKTSFKSIIKITVGLVMTIGMLLGGWLYVIQDGSIGGVYTCYFYYSNSKAYSGKPIFFIKKQYSSQS